MSRLLERQAALLAHLTSPAAIFGSRRGPSDARLAGLDRDRLHLEASFSYEKRMEKIHGVFPKTFELLGSASRRVTRDFAAACPPADIGRLHNARQFRDFLCRRWRRKPPRRAYLPDVLACEFALAEARSHAESGAATPVPQRAGRAGRIRRRPGVILLRCRHDIRPLFEGTSSRVTRRTIGLAITVATDADEPEVVELPAPVFALLTALDNPRKRMEIGTGTGLDAVLDALAARGLVETYR